MESYGQKAFDFSSHDITVTIPFNRINILEWGDKHGDKQRLNDTQIKVMKLISDNANITKPQIAKRLSIGKTTVDRVIDALKEKGYIVRIGSKKTGYWKVLD